MLELMMACAVLEACVRTYGPDLASIRFHEARGVGVELRMLDGVVPERLNGELLAVRDSDVVIIERGPMAPAVWVVRVSDIESIKSAWSAGLSRSFDGSEVGELRPISRFPHGLTPAVMAELLGAHDQAEPRTTTRS